jgi:2-polyprenyl-6-methoxyphenol hydroxylase-like FAD-dependent oxidoreductase
MRVVVVGAGIGGLAAAVGLARGGHEVRVLERDASPLPGNAEEAFSTWSRPGTPQARMHHGFSARARQELLAHAPDVMDDLTAAEVAAADLGWRLPRVRNDPGEDLRAFNARRLTVEWALRKAAEASGAAIEAGAAAAGVAVDDSTTRRRIVGVTTAKDRFAADLVVDAGGRRSPIRGYLSALGVEFPKDAGVPCGIAYSNRYMRLRDGAQMPAIHGQLVERGDLGFLGYVIGLADARTYSLVFAFPAREPVLRGLGSEEGWRAGAPLIDRFSVFADPDVGSPLTPPTLMYGLENTLRPWYVADVPVVDGIVFIADSWSTTDPLFGWGGSFSLAHGFGIADVVARHGADVDGAVRDFVASYREEVEQRYRQSCTDDIAMSARWAGEPDPRDRRDIEREALLFGATRAARRDLALLRALIRRQTLLDLPDEIWADTALCAAAAAASELESHPYDPLRVTPGPPRDEFFAALDSRPTRRDFSGLRSASGEPQAGPESRLRGD